MIAMSCWAALPNARSKWTVVTWCKFRKHSFQRESEHLNCPVIILKLMVLKATGGVPKRERIDELLSVQYQMPHHPRSTIRFRTTEFGKILNSKEDSSAASLTQILSDIGNYILSLFQKLYFCQQRKHFNI